MITIYGKDDCKFCILVTNICISNNLDYRYYKVHEDITKEDLENKIGEPVNTVPQIFIDNEYIGGYSEFKLRMRDIHG